MRIVPTHISSLYKNALVYLWVEDEETRAYLEEAWDHDDTIGLLVAGGCENIAAVVSPNANRKLFPKKSRRCARFYVAASAGDASLCRLAVDVPSLPRRTIPQFAHQFTHRLHSQKSREQYEPHDGRANREPKRNVENELDP